jgi:hypothetical protein
MKRTTLWHVTLREAAGGREVVVSHGELPGAAIHRQRIRTISPRAAGRKYIRASLATQLYLHDDGMHAPGDLQPGSDNAKYAAHLKRREHVRVRIAKD